MPERLQDQPDRLPAARCTSVNADVGRGAQELSLRSGLRRDRPRGYVRHVALGGMVVAVFRRQRRLVTRNRKNLMNTTMSSAVLDPGSYRRFLAKYFACASRSTSVSSGSRLLSGRTR